MSGAEFDLIKRFFTFSAKSALLGVGDDGALVCPEDTLAVSTDMLVSGVHFFPDDDPFWIGHKAMAVNLSDMAAMGAKPKWATLAISLPGVDENWIGEFSKGFMSLAQRHEVDLIGGDTTKGPLSMCVQIMGEVPFELALRRDKAKEGDCIWVSGDLGDAALGLSCLQHKITLGFSDAAYCLDKLRKPDPRVALGLSLRGISSCAIDISDGLCADLGHICERSNVAAVIDIERIPRSAVLEKYRNDPVAEQAFLAGGDDYELCFVCAEEKSEKIRQIGKTLNLKLTQIGQMEKGLGVVLRDRGQAKKIQRGGFEHFS